MRPFVDLKTAKTIYNSLIKPLFDYCDVVWDTIGAVSSTRLQKLNNRAARVITYGADTSRCFLRGSGVKLSLPKPNTDYMKKSLKFWSKIME